jgi:hypothetical protein
MWPFSTPKAVREEPEQAPYELLDSIKRKLEALERRHEDLHDSYMKLRATIAARARREVAEEVPPPGYAEPGVPGNSERPALLSHKEELRRRLLPGITRR